MCLLLETIKLENGKFQNLNYHQKRINQSYKSLFNSEFAFNLSNYIETISIPKIGKFKLRIIYNLTELNYTLSEYYLPQINSFKLIFSNSIHYTYKYANRELLDNLFKLKDKHDDIIIVKNNLISDSYFANLIFFDGHKWWTPKKPLLNGTKRQQLIEDNKIFECDISCSDLHKYKYVKIINSMIDIDDTKAISCNNIH